MTKLIEWLSVLSAGFAIWYSLVGGYVKHPLVDEYMSVIQLAPLYLALLFGLYAIVVVAYRVFTFNDCEDAAKELQEQIQEAEKDLHSKGVEW